MWLLIAAGVVAFLVIKVTLPPISPHDPITRRRDLLDAHFQRLYDEICPELEYALDVAQLSPNFLDGDLQQAINLTEWVFQCEWDASIDYWYNPIRDDGRTDLP